MISEYVKFDRPEQVFTQKTFLESEIDVLDCLRSYRRYKKLRDEELMLKVALKIKVEQVLSNLYSLEKLLPKTQLRPKKTKDEENIITREIDLSLEEEIDEIKRKIAKLI